MKSVYIGEKKRFEAKSHTEERKSSKDGGRDLSDVFISQGTPRKREA